MEAITIKTVLDYWFGEIREDSGYLEERFGMWFSGGARIDAEVTERFKLAIEPAAGGERDGWQTTPQGRLALILVLDQFSRHVYRGKPDAFRQDKKAQTVCLDGLAACADLLLHPIQRAFFYLPLEHAEDLTLQRRSIACYEKLAREAPAPIRVGMENTRDYAIRHHDIIERFGRFPHRNEILGRKSTPEEIEFLKEPNSSF